MQVKALQLKSFALLKEGKQEIKRGNWIRARILIGQAKSIASKINKNPKQKIWTI